ncbi:zinc ribbon domain-containing protein [Patescibacteria group bacterium]|nr:zinc ribbon domain-containing protein [Patescibacteria group bacterium]
MRKRLHQFLLRGFAYCSECGQRYTAEWHFKPRFTRRNGKIAYYHCPKMNRNGCPAPYVEVSELEELVRNTVKSIQFSQEFVDAVVAKAKEFVDDSRKRATSETQGCINQRIALENRRNKLEDALLDGTIDRVVFKRKHDEIQEQLGFIDSRIREIETNSRVDIKLIEDVLNFTRDIGRTYDEAEEFLQRHFLRFFFEKIIVKERKIERVIYTPVIATLVENRQVIIKNLMLLR